MRPVRLVGYLTYGLGMIILLLGAAMPFYFAGLAVHQGPTSTQLSAQSRPCDMSTTTFTDANGTHRAFSVTCYETGIGSESLSATFIPGPGSLSAALSSVFIVLSIVSAIGVTMIAIVFQGEALGKTKVLIPSFVALCAFSSAIALTVVFGLSGPLSGSSPPQWGVYALIASTFWGYGLSILALAGIVIDKDQKP